MYELFELLMLNVDVDQEEGLRGVRLPEALAVEHQSGGEHHLWDAHDQAQVTPTYLSNVLHCTTVEGLLFIPTHSGGTATPLTVA